MSSGDLEKLLQITRSPQTGEGFLRSLTPKSAQEIGRLALLRLQARADPADIPEIDNFLAALQLIRDRVTLPLGEPETTLRILRSLGVHTRCPSPEPVADQAEQLCEKARRCFHEGSWDEARYFFSLALASPAIDSNSRIQSLRVVANIHHNRGEFEQELGIIKYLSAHVSESEPMMRSEVLMQEGNALTELRKFAQAEAAYVSAIHLAGRLRPRPLHHISNAIVNLTNVRHAQMDRSKPELWRRMRGYYASSYHLLLRAGEHVENVGGLRADRLVNMAWTCAKEADVTPDELASRRLLRRCGLLARLALWHNRQGPAEQPERREAHILGTLNRAFEALGQLDRAEECHRRAVDLADLQIERPDIRWDSRWSYSDFCLRHRRWTKAYSLAKQAHVLAEEERARRELREGRTGLSRANARIYEALIEAEIGRRGLEGARPSVVFNWIEMAKARSSLDAIAGGVAGQRYRSGIASPVPYRRFMTAMKPGACLIEYFKLNDRILVLTASKALAGLHFLEGSAKEIMDEGASLIISAREGGISPIRLQSLASQVLTPVIEEFREKPSLLVVVPQGSLHGLPFHALQVNSSYLVEQMPIVYSPSASIFHRVSRRRRQTDPFLGVAVSEASLARSREETESLALDRSAALEPLIDDDATVDEFLRVASKAGTIHFACHGEAKPDPMESFLQLGDGPLTVARLLAGPRLRAAHIFINACFGGAEEVDIGEEHLGLTTAFLQAGAAAVIGAMSETSDRYGPDFAKEYYSAVERGATRPEALQQAQLSFLTSDRKHLRHPMYWAPYFLTGC